MFQTYNKLSKNLASSANSVTAASAFASADQPRGRQRILNSPTSDLTKYVSFQYNSVGSLLVPNDTTIINSPVVGTFVNDPQKSIPLPADQAANFTFPHIRRVGVSNPRCVYWDTENM